MEAQIIANELKDKGFIATYASGYVFVSLQNRKVSTMEVRTAIDEIGFDSFRMMSVGNEVQVTVS